MTGPLSIARLAKRLRRDRRGLGVVEFALAAPFMILIYVGSFQLMDAISCYRKVSITDHALADLATRQKTITPDQAQTILSAARQVMTPYSTAGATLIITEISIDKDGVPHVVWYKANDSTVVHDSDLAVPDDIRIPNSYLILSKIIYHYRPVVGAKLIGPMIFEDHIYMNPRISESICLNTGSAANPQCVEGGGTA